ncbi:MAG: tRNA-(ms[2]io[6]A)-hydroxylase [Chitinophagales bacterium]|nr:tRNA-(ms[2]io[6]A)-hydroxylase [Chitinophagales bacterium]
MLGLKLPTDPRWANLAEKSLEDILSDHAYCEQKAASTGISLIQRYADKEELVAQVAPLVTEEWGHFRQVLAELKKRGLKLGKQRKDEYAIQLFKFERKGGSRDDQLLEKLLVSAMIEARSCERFRVLSLNIADNSLQKFYHDFMISEAGHYRMFIELAEYYCSKEKMKIRWQEYLEAEAEIMKQLELRGDRVH